MKPLRNNKVIATIFYGIASLFNIFPVTPRKDLGNIDDASKIAEDWKRVGQDLYAALYAFEYGEK